LVNLWRIKVVNSGKILEAGTKTWNMRGVTGGSLVPVIHLVSLMWMEENLL